MVADNPPAPPTFRIQTLQTKMRWILMWVACSRMRYKRYKECLDRAQEFPRACRVVSETLVIWNLAGCYWAIVTYIRPLQ